MHFSVAILAIGIISVRFDQSTYIVDENIGEFEVTLVLDRPSIDPITVIVYSNDGTAMAGEC